MCGCCWCGCFVGGVDGIDLVFKDYNLPPIPISVIPRNYFETVKEWLDSFNIKFYQSERNYNWKRIMDTIKSDVKKFHDDGV
ncbi:hypothetical protein DDB_G0282545 [Dictyostelium discoideum AX4]|uniref:FACT complex subunit n=1 Tax=Dictyostelium discoideum TaxID=44689 RepID=Q54SC6_DICDI|nr:hypothetical protein DDB_G0282545 [Dictyostelium discoideum AX4]EAL66132.1 hypothetical protein DDB_G0282545 [Dictyostelium discoideum AX4]|eukprot:XP_640113.1 hypothetical protein DDB_G0282545 [Dictyostelium discoideum AX4]